MKDWFVPTVDNLLYGWLGFVLLLLLVSVCLGALMVWLTIGRERHGKRRRRRRHRRPTNPTLAQMGGLPPRRDPNLPPHGT